ncbi:hypothetical protein SBA6_150018 [Candidatus Sulfopaludibacter sp. SbA6]|nr:hypothetical protein SBA6_150018 [Candidatus Sulfopaludibacter sp. SbA6]
MSRGESRIHEELLRYHIELVHGLLAYAGALGESAWANPTRARKLQQLDFTGAAIGFRSAETYNTSVRETTFKRHRLSVVLFLRCEILLYALDVAGQRCRRGAGWVSLLCLLQGIQYGMKIVYVSIE